MPPVNPLDDYSYTPPYTSPTISLLLLLPHYQYQYRNNRLPHPYKRNIPILPTTIPQISPLLPHDQDQYRNLPHPYSLRWYYHPKVGKGSLIDFTRFRVKGCRFGELCVSCPRTSPNSFSCRAIMKGITCVVHCCIKTKTIRTGKVYCA